MTRYSRVLVSYPKSGRTWLWYAACKAISYEYGIALKRGGSLKWLKNPLFAKAGIPLASSTHAFWADQEQKVLTADKLGFMVRDPRDIIVSAFFWRDVPDFDKHVTDEALKLGRWAQEWGDAPVEFTFRCEYENLHEAFLPTLLRFLAWLGVEVSGAALLFAKVESSFDRMHATDPKKARRGIPGDWRNHLTNDQERRVWSILDGYAGNTWERYRGD